MLPGLPSARALTACCRILRNTVAGLHGIDPAVLEAAARRRDDADRERLVAGRATAGAARSWLPASAPPPSGPWAWPRSTPVGATSLGNYVFAGLQTRNSASILIGCAAAAALALGLDFLVRQVATGLGDAPARPDRLSASSASALLAAWAWSVRRRDAAARAAPGAHRRKDLHRAVRARGDPGRGRALARGSRGRGPDRDSARRRRLRRARREARSTSTSTTRERSELTVMHRTAAAGPRERVLEDVRTWLSRDARDPGWRRRSASRTPTASRYGARPPTACGYARSATCRDTCRLSRLASDYEFFSRARSGARSSAPTGSRSARNGRWIASLLYQAHRGAPGGRGDGLLVGRPHRRARPRDARGREGRDPPTTRCESWRCARIARESPEVMACRRAPRRRDRCGPHAGAQPDGGTRRGRLAQAAAAEFLK